jgi:2-polyprenyl-3-methyl-5-hydroxy-6-metoxy-1,4-benzoquinol methylase
MLDAKEHYDNHLGNFYSWMVGDFQSKASEFKDFLLANGILPRSTIRAIDLGSGHGIQTVPLAQIGFQVLAVDFNQQLLNELEKNTHGLSVKATNGDLRDFAQHSNSPELVLCCGDTISHLESKQEIELLIRDIADALVKNGKLILSFRDYSKAFTGTERFIPVKNDSHRILTCFLEYDTDHVVITDLLHERSDAGWIQKVSSYQKVRITTEWIVQTLIKSGFQVDFNQIVNRLTTIIATR